MGTEPRKETPAMDGRTYMALGVLAWLAGWVLNQGALGLIVGVALFTLGVVKWRRRA